jgi:hypothetical protein
MTQFNHNISSRAQNMKISIGSIRRKGGHGRKKRYEP